MQDLCERLDIKNIKRKFISLNNMIQLNSRQEQIIQQNNVFVMDKKPLLSIHNNAHGFQIARFTCNLQKAVPKHFATIRRLN